MRGGGGDWPIFAQPDESEVFQLFVEGTRLRTRRFLAAHMELVLVAINYERLCERTRAMC